MQRFPALGANSLVKEKERNPGQDMLSEVGVGCLRGHALPLVVQGTHMPHACMGSLVMPDDQRCRSTTNFGTLSRPPITALPPSVPLCWQIVKNDLRNGNISREQLIAHAFLLVVRTLGLQSLGWLLKSVGQLDTSSVHMRCMWGTCFQPD